MRNDSSQPAIDMSPILDRLFHTSNNTYLIQLTWSGTCSIMKLLNRLLLYKVFLLAALPANATEVIGWVEYVVVHDDVNNVIMKAKIDTGAKTTSIHSDDYTIFKKRGQDWVRFSLTNHEGKTIWLEEPVVRYSKIKRHFTESQVRPVINLVLCLGNTFHRTDVNLVDRGKFKYQLLIGRRYLETRFLVDPGQTFIAEPACQEK